MENQMVTIISDSEEIDIESACREIGQAWHASIDALLNVVSLFRKYHGRKGFKELQVELDQRGIMKESVFSMFKTIAQNPLIDYNIKDKLPAAYNTLYHIAKIDDEEVFIGSLEDGRIRSDMTVEEARKEYKLYTGQISNKISIRKKTELVPLASIKIKKSVYRSNQSRINELLKELADLGVVVKKNEALK